LTIRFGARGWGWFCVDSLGISLVPEFVEILVSVKGDVLGVFASNARVYDVWGFVKVL
jgi:RNase adaptor protein for sRNA GlmZ degradation